MIFEKGDDEFLYKRQWPLLPWRFLSSLAPVKPPSPFLPVWARWSNVAVCELPPTPQLQWPSNVIMSCLISSARVGGCTNQAHVCPPKWHRKFRFFRLNSWSQLCAPLAALASRHSPSSVLLLIRYGQLWPWLWSQPSQYGLCGWQKY